MRKNSLIAVMALCLFGLSLPANAWHKLSHRPPRLPPLVTGIEPMPSLMFMGPVYRRYRRGLRPWSRAWFRSCRRRYRSFNSSTGYFTGYDGRRRFCR